MRGDYHSGSSGRAALGERVRWISSVAASAGRTLSSRARSRLHRSSSRDLVVGILSLAILSTLAFYAAERVLAMGGVDDCASCHTVTLANHPNIRCYLCHDDGSEGGPTDYRLFTDAVPDSHNPSDPSSTTCAGCHSAMFPNVPQHTDAALEVTHATTTTGCDECHETSLLAEHEKYPSGSAIKYECDVCHSSTDPLVVAAIASGNTACGACHNLETAHAFHDNAVVPECAECHGSDLVGLHPGCDTCHATTPPPGATCITCHPTMVVDHGAGPFNFPFNDHYYGYLSWTYAQSISAADSTSPHGNYTTSTYKCAVCHSVHKAEPSGKVLTAWPGVTTTTNMAPYESCMWCHGTSSPLFANSRISVGAELSPHGYCGRCHARSVHGADGSDYAVLRARMINTNADGAIAAEIAAGTNNVGAVDFSDAGDAGALTLGTGYLCGSCHSGALALPVNESGATPFQTATARTTVTGHRVQAMVTDNWNDDGAYGVYYSSGYTESTIMGGPIAFNPVATTRSGCMSCHDATMPDGTIAFPHNYIDSAGSPALKTDLGSSYIWLTIAGDADDARVISGKTVTGSTDAKAGTVDGLCLKCHLSADRTAGVGQTF